MSDEKRVECTIREGRFVDPCWALDEMVENNTPGFSSAKGIAKWSLTNLNTGKPSRVFFGIKSKAHPKGMLFNNCPFCGADISAPFLTKKEEGSDQ